MKRLFIALILMANIVFSPPSEAGLIRDAGRSCVFGAALLATTTYLGLTQSMLSTGPITLPFTIQSTIAYNAVVGCGVTAAAATAASVFTLIYDAIF